jgi:hypothetical protein
MHVDVWTTNPDAKWAHTKHNKWTCLAAWPLSAKIHQEYTRDITTYYNTTWGEPTVNIASLQWTLRAYSKHCEPTVNIESLQWTLVAYGECCMNVRNATNSYIAMWEEHDSNINLYVMCCMQTIKISQHKLCITHATAFENLYHGRTACDKLIHDTWRLYNQGYR